MPVLGVLPFRAEMPVDQEDSLGLDETASDGQPNGDLRDGHCLDIAVIRLPHISNSTDFRSLSRVPSVHVRYVRGATELGMPDLVILPGTKATVRDLDWLRAVGLADALTARASRRGGA